MISEIQNIKLVILVLIWNNVPVSAGRAWAANPKEASSIHSEAYVSYFGGKQSNFNQMFKIQPVSMGIRSHIIRFEGNSNLCPHQVSQTAGEDTHNLKMYAQPRNKNQT